MTTPLLPLILKKIHAEGPLSVADYMALCLYHPQHGYYMTQQPLGAEGDFITAPELTPLFGQTLAIWVAKTWEKLGQPAAFTLVEGGPGRGTLMHDLLGALKRMSPACYAAATVCLLEVSPRLRGEQAMRLQKHAVDWAETLAEVPWQQPTLFIANELLDAFPIVQTLPDGTERTVTEADGLLAFSTPAEGITETSPAQTAFLEELKAHLTHGAALFIDYGYTSGHGDTLQAIHQHRQVDPLTFPGAADLTAHVNFTAVAKTLGNKQCQLEDQATFLLRHGLALRATQALETAPDATTREHIESACQRLISPKEMGRLFKVLCWTP